jgi:alkaline phosphatase D
MTFPRERHRLFKRMSFGGVADLFLLDERQYRTGKNDGLERSMLGRGQLDWLLAELRGSRATWKLVANQVVMAGRQEGEERASGDSWDGYADERARILGELEQRGIDNVVFLTGDAHVFMASHLAADFENYDANRKPAGVEFVGGSVTSPGPDFPEQEIRDRAPWVEMYRGGAHGYAQADLRPDRMDTVFLEVPVTDSAPNASIFQRFTQFPGTNRVQRS